MKQQALTSHDPRGESIQCWPRQLFPLEYKLHGFQLGLVDPGAPLHRPDTAVHDVRVPPSRRPGPQRRDGHLLVRRLHRRRRRLRRALRLPREHGVLERRSRHRLRLLPMVRPPPRPAPRVHVGQWILGYVDV